MKSPLAAGAKPTATHTHISQISGESILEGAETRKESHDEIKMRNGMPEETSGARAMMRRGRRMKKSFLISTTGKIIGRERERDMTVRLVPVRIFSKCNAN